jgi:hypothetical protein
MVQDGMTELYALVVIRFIPLFAAVVAVMNDKLALEGAVDFRYRDGNRDLSGILMSAHAIPPPE